MKVKAIIVDLDRTLLHTDKTLSPYTLEVLKKCKKNGIKIMIATARPWRNTVPYCEMLDFDALSVTNGARIICNGKCTEYGISKKSAEKLLTSFRYYPDLRITLETGDVAYSNKPIEEYETVVFNDLASVAKAEGALKILVGIDKENTLELVKKELTSDLYYTVANNQLIQIMDKAATKWNGVKAMLEINNISASEAIYFGDDYDDIESIKKCGIGVAVSNGINDVKSIADYITDSNDEDGVAKFIERMILYK